MKPIPSAVKRQIFLYKLILPGIPLIIICAFIGFHLSRLDLYAYFLLNENSPVSTGQIIDKWVERYTYHEETDKEYYMYAYRYTFNSPDGVPVYWTSYSTDPKHKTGDKIKIQYYAEAPRINKAVGMLSHNGQRFLLIESGFFLWLAIAAGFYTKPFQALGIMKHGEITRGKLIKVIQRNEYRETERLVFHYKPKTGKGITTTVRSIISNALTDDPKELLIYHVHKPHRIIMVDSMPQKAKEYFYTTYEHLLPGAKKRKRKKLRELRAKNAEK